MEKKKGQPSSVDWDSREVMTGIRRTKKKGSDSWDNEAKKGIVI